MVLLRVVILVVAAMSCQMAHALTGHEIVRYMSAVDKLERGDTTSRLEEIQAAQVLGYIGGVIDTAAATGQFCPKTTIVTREIGRIARREIESGRAKGRDNGAVIVTLALMMRHPCPEKPSRD